MKKFILIFLFLAGSVYLNDNQLSSTPASACFCNAKTLSSTNDSNFPSLSYFYGNIFSGEIENGSDENEIKAACGGALPALFNKDHFIFESDHYISSDRMAPHSPIYLLYRKLRL